LVAAGRIALFHVGILVASRLPYRPALRVNPIEGGFFEADDVGFLPSFVQWFVAHPHHVTHLVPVTVVTLPAPPPVDLDAVGQRPSARLIQETDSELGAVQHNSTHSDVHYKRDNGLNGQPEQPPG
jgi:hypothetical protein